MSDELDLYKQLTSATREARSLRRQIADELDKRYPLRAQLARNMVRLRKERGWTQEDLAEKTNLHRNQIGAIEQRRQSTGIDIIEILTHTFGVLPGELLNPYPAPSFINSTADTSG
ncbi:helix-turn-helix domain-containing protein [Deinococcus sp. UYEF24]